MPGLQQQAQALPQQTPQQLVQNNPQTAQQIQQGFNQAPAHQTQTLIQALQSLFGVKK